MAEDLELALQVRADIQQAVGELKALRGQVAGVGEAGERASRKTNLLFRELSTGNEILDRNLRLVRNVGLAIGAIGAAGTVAAVTSTTRAYASLEEGLVGVQKTANLTNAETEDLKGRIQDLATEIPATTEELLANAEAAGQLGVQGVDNITAYATTIAKLGRTTDIAGSEAAKGIARILNVTGEGQDQVDEFGSVLVALGNDAAASESEILRITNEVARATAEFDVSSAEAAALGTSLREMGVRAEAGGTSVGRVMREIASAVTEGGDKMERLQEVTGKTREELQEMSDLQRLVAFLEGIRDRGGRASAALEEFGLGGEEIAKTIPTLIQNVDRLKENLSTAGTEAENAGALQAEFEKAVGSLKAELDLLNSTFDVAQQKVGEELAPHIREASEDLRDFLNNDAAVARFAEALGSVVDTFIQGARVAADFYAIVTDRPPIQDIRFPEVTNLDQAQRATQALRDQRAVIEDEIPKLEAKLEELGNKNTGGLDTIADFRETKEKLQERRMLLEEYAGAIAEGEERIQQLRQAQDEEADSARESGEAHQEQAERIHEAGASAEEFEEALKSATEAAKESAASQRGEWQRVAEQIKDQADPLRAIRREMRVTQAAMDQGLVPDDLGMARLMQLQAEMDEVGRSADEAKEDAAEAFGGMSEFAIKARRNIQSELADTLVDTMQGSYDSILEGWVRLMQRMVAEAAAAEIMSSLTGEGQEGEGLLSAAGSWLSSYFSGGGGSTSAGTAHTGGIAGEIPASRSVSPLLFAGAERYHAGGMAGLGPNEVPIIAERGEEVLTKEDPRHRANGGMGAPITVNQSFAGGQPPEEVRRSAKQGGLEAARALQRAKERN
jgi:TP901 family phage tail tape measure protein